MKIGLFTELFPPSLGGQEIRFSQIARGLAARGHRVDVYCIAHERALAPHETVDGYHVHRYPVAPHYQRPLVAALRRSPVAVVRYAWWARRVLARERFDLVLMNQWPYLHILAAPRRALRHAVIDWCEAREGLVYRVAQALLPRLSRANIAVSQGVARRIAHASGRPLTYLPSGIHVAEYAPGAPERRRDILSLGRLVEHKNLSLLVQAFGVAAQRGYPHDLLIAGDGPWEGALRREIDELPVRSRIHLLGRVADGDKLKLLSRADLLVITSRREGFPRVIAEAMASGLPTVTVDYPDNGSSDVVRMYGTGHVARPTPADVAEAMLCALQQRDALSERCVAEARALDWNHLLPILEDLAGHEVMAIDNLSFGKREYLAGLDVRLVEIDLGTVERARLLELIEGWQPAVVVHLAGLHFIPYCVAHPDETFAANVRGTYLVAEAARLVPSVERIVFASTMDVYCNQDRVHSENDPSQPSNIYGLSKALGETAVAYAARSRPGLAALIFRFANIYGPEETNPHLIPDVVARLKDRTADELRMGDLEPNRDFVHVHDLCKLLMEATTGSGVNTGVFNVGTGISTSVRTVVDMLREMAGDERPVVEDAGQLRSFARRSLAPSMDRTFGAFGWRPSISLRDGLAMLYESEAR